MYYRMNNHLAPPSPEILAIPMTSDQCSSAVMHSQVSMHNQNYQQSPKMAQLSPSGLTSFQPNHTSQLCTADPSSPMQTTYVHGGMRANGFETAALTIPQTLLIPPHPPPNYAEATAMGKGPLYTYLPPDYDSIMIGNEYSPHITAQLPYTHPSLT